MFSEGRVARSWIWFVLLAIAVVVVLEGSATSLWAQEATSAPPKEAMGGLTWFWHAAGLIGMCIIGVSVYFVAQVGMYFVQLRKDVAIPPEIVGQCEAMLEQRDFKGIFNVVKEDDSFFSRVLVTGITELPNGISEARESMERIAQMLTVEMEKRISILAVLGTLGPMIGLLGTLKGMISAFYAIATGGAALQADKVAMALSEALVLTFMGVALSVPSIYFFSFFRNRVMTIAVTATNRADEFLRHFAQAARGKGPAPAATPAPAAAAAAAPARKV